jgi:PAS domain S-box-containing protein
MTNNESKLSLEYFAESAVATFIVTPNCEVIFWNKACEELTGINASEVMFTNAHWAAFYQTKRACLVDIIIDGNLQELPNLYEKYGKSKLSKEGINAEGWYENLGGKKRYIVFDAAPIFNDSGELLAGIETLHDITEIKNSEKEKEELFEKLITNIANNNALRGFIPICSSCKNIRDKKSDWLSFEEYFDKKLDIRFSHGLCPKCAHQLYPDFFDKIR